MVAAAQGGVVEEGKKEMMERGSGARDGDDDVCSGDKGVSMRTRECSTVQRVRVGVCKRGRKEMKI